MFLNAILIWFAFSAREPNIAPNPFDYELSTGWETKQTWFETDAKFLWERENGSFYTGRIHNYEAKYIQAGEYVKDAKDISKQKAHLKLPRKWKWLTWEFGAGVIADHYEDPQLSFLNKLKTKYVEAEISNFTEIHYFSLKGKYRWTHKNGIFIEPVARLYLAGEKKDWQAKIKFGYKFSQKFGKIKMK